MEFRKISFSVLNSWFCGVHQYHFLLAFGHGCRTDPFSMKKVLPKYHCAKTTVHVFETSEHVISMCWEEVVHHSQHFPW